MTVEFISNCDNCGAALDGDQCSYCGTGVVAVLKRIKQAAGYVVQPKAKPKVAEIIQVCASSASEMREIAKQNAETHRKQVCIAKAVSRIDRLVEKAVLAGNTTIEFGQIYIRLDKYEKEGIRSHYKKLGFQLTTDISWTTRMPPNWNMAEYDKAYLSW